MVCAKHIYYLRWSERFKRMARVSGELNCESLRNNEIQLQIV